MTVLLVCDSLDSTVALILWHPFTKPADLVQMDWLLQVSIVTIEAVTIHFARGCCQRYSTFLLLPDGLDAAVLHSTKGSWVTAQAP